MKLSLAIVLLCFQITAFGAGPSQKAATPAVAKKATTKPTAKSVSKPAKVMRVPEVANDIEPEKEIVLSKPDLSLLTKARIAMFVPRKAYLDLEDGNLQSVFSVPGRDWRTCDMDKNCERKGWPDNNAEIEVLSPPMKFKTYDFNLGKEVDQEFVKIKYKYSRQSAPDSKERGGMLTQEGEGWIDAAYVTNKKRDAFFTERPKNPTRQFCTDDRAKQNLKDIAVVAKSAAGINAITAEVMKVTGQCVIDPRQPRRFEKGNVYDNYVMPTVLKQKVPKVRMEDGTNMTSQDIVEIDSLARSIYGEMAGCFKHGLHYPMTVAKIVRNRAQSNRLTEFIKGPHEASKNTLTKVVTSASQFNVWMRNHGDKMNPSLKMALCPPGDRDQIYWQGRKPGPQELQIWENAMRIATQAVVQPKEFDRRTKDVSGYFYTSGMGQFYKMDQVHPIIEDRQVVKNACLEVWMEKRKPAASIETKKRK